MRSRLTSSWCRKKIRLVSGCWLWGEFVNDWANPEATRRSWDMVARYVVPEVNGMLDAYRESQSHVINNREVFDRAGE